MASAGRLSQVFLNLIINARDAMDGRGTIRLEVRRRIANERAQVAVTVSDEGTGIPEELLDRVFEPFFTTKPDGQGTGLGLAVSRGLVEKLGGRIELDNRLGHGCTFSVVLGQDADGGGISDRVAGDNCRSRAGMCGADWLRAVQQKRRKTGVRDKDD